MNRFFTAALMLVSTLAFAGVGKVTLLEGKATRTPEKGAAVALAVGSEIEVKDTIKVDGGNMKLELADGSEIALADKSSLVIDEATFGTETKSFLGTLKSGSLWTKVKKLVGDSKYEVKTDRAVAGVRGTIFRIDADALVKSAKGRSGTLVRVQEGLVRVNPSKSVAKSLKAAAKKAKGPRKEVAGPTEISADDWEKKFVELQAGQAQFIGGDLYDAAVLEEAEKNDAFNQWLEKK